VNEPEQYMMSQSVAGRISSIVNIHNPSIEIHLVDRAINTGAAVILVAGGGHNTLNVGSEAADFVTFFYNYGVNTIILRNRLRRDGYNPQTDAVNDAEQSIRLVRAYAKDLRLDPNKIGMMNSPPRQPFCTTISTRRITPLPTRSPAFPRAPISRALFIRDLRPLPRSERRRRFRAMFRRHLLFAVVREIGCMLSGRWNTSTRCSLWAYPT
jgi:hypothetical protein